MRDEVRTMLWLQWRLTTAIFRSRHGRHRLRALNLILRALQLVLVIPGFIGLGIGLGVALGALSAPAAAGLVVLVSGVLTFFWLLGPVIEESRVIERFEILRLVPYPVSFRGLVVGSTLASVLSLPGMASAPLLLGQVGGLAWHRPLALPALLLGAALAYVMWLLVGRLIEDVVDLIGANRRLRGILIGALTLPLVLLWVANISLSLGTGDLLSEWIRSLGPAETPSAFLEALQVHRWAGWLPFTWPALLMGSATTGAWGRAAAYAVLSAGLVAGMGWGHYALTRRLASGAALGRERSAARTTRWRLDWPGPTSFWALVRKDALYLWRNPLTRRIILFTPLLSVFMTVMFVAPISIRPFPTTPEVTDLIALILGVAWPVFLSLTVNGQLLSNYFGSVDREGFGTIAYAAVDRRQVLASAGLVTLLVALFEYMLPIVATAAFTGLWLIVPIGLAASIMVQVGGAPAYLLASIMGPYRAQCKMSGQNQGGGLWGLLAWVVTLPPLAVLIVLPYAAYRPALWATLPLGVLLSGAAFWLALRPLANLMLRREQEILAAVVKED